MVQTPAIYPITVNYDLSIEQVMEFCPYVWVHDSITSKNFSTKRTGKSDLTFEIIHFNNIVSIEDILKEIDRMGYRPAELHELLALGKKYPELRSGVVALGSIWQDHYHGRHCIPYPTRAGSRISLDILSVDSLLGVSGFRRFAVVRK